MKVASRSGVRGLLRKAPLYNPVKVKNVFPLMGLPDWWVGVDDTLFFGATEFSGDGIGDSNYELWKSDGTEAGTTMVTADIQPFVAGSLSGGWPFSWATLGGDLFFPGTDVHGDQGVELWKTDGTAAGTVLVKDIATGADSSMPMSLLNVDGRLFFVASDPEHGRELWTSDGTEAGTQVLDLTPGPADSALNPLITGANGLAFFAMADPATGVYSLWKSDGTPAGTGMISDVMPMFSDWPMAQAAAGDTLFFTGCDAAGAQGNELWKSDGTPAGTMLVKDIMPGPDSSMPMWLVPAGDRVFFSVVHPEYGQQLWGSDGTEAGTQMVNLPAGSCPWQFAAVGDDFYFAALDPSDPSYHVHALWKVGAASEPLQVTVDNAAPTITSICSSSAGFGGAAQGQDVTVSAAFVDLGLLDTHSAVIDWGDGTVTAATIAESAGLGTAVGSHAYAQAGFYTVTVTVTDDDGSATVATTKAVVAGIGVHDGVLQVIGTNADDHVNIVPSGHDRLRVQASFLPGGCQSVAVAGVSRIAVLLGGGDDRVNIADCVRIAVLVDGGSGDDWLSGGGGPNILLGGDGDDILNAGSHRDVLIGGAGRDRLIGHCGGDLLIAGRTSLDLDYSALGADFDSALMAVLAEWNSELPYHVRVGRLQEMFTALDDDAKDTLFGGSGRDCFFANLQGGVLDRIMDRKCGELIVEL